VPSVFDELDDWQIGKWYKEAESISKEQEKASKGK
jgi:hypothetical protein